MSLSKPQRGVALGAGSAAIMTAVSLVFASLHPPGTEPTLEARLHVFALTGLGPTLALVVCIGRLANHRFNTPDDLDGGGLTVGSPRAKVLQALLQNTLEQLAIAVVAYATCSLLGAPRLLPMVAAASALFVVGRALFFWGYAKGAAGRALGFGLTFYPTLVLLGFAVLAAASYAAG